MIYDFALPKDQLLGHRYEPPQGPPPRRSPRRLPPSTAPAVKRKLTRPGFLPNLLLVSKQVRDEAAPMLYANNPITITAKFSRAQFCTLSHRLQTQYQDSFKHIKTLTLRITAALNATERAECTCNRDPRVKIDIELKDGELTCSTVATGYGSRCYSCYSCTSWLDFYGRQEYLCNDILQMLKEANPEIKPGSVRVSHTKPRTERNTRYWTSMKI